MALNYTTLQSTVLDYSHRSDLADKVAGFIARAESRINQRVRMAAQRVEGPATLTAGASSVALPTNCVQVLAVYLEPASGARYEPLRFVPAHRARGFTAVAQMNPARYTVRDAIYLDAAPTEDRSLKVEYYEGFDIASEPLGENALLTKAEQVYVNATLAELYRYLQDEERANYYGGLAAAEVESINVAERKLDGTHGATARTEVATVIGGDVFNINEG